MRIIVIDAGNDGKQVEIADALATQNPHLAVHETLASSDRPEAWTVSHVPSGSALCYFDSIDDAFLYAEGTCVAGVSWEFGSLGDSKTGQPENILEIHMRALGAVWEARRARRT